MVCRVTIVGAALLLVALTCAHGLTLKEMMEADIAEKESKALGIKQTPKPDNAATAAPKPEQKPGTGKPETTGKPAAAFVAAPQAAPMMASGGGAASSGGAALGTSAMIGIGVGVGVACLVAVGSVVGVLVHLRRRKSKGAPLDKQKTYGGTE